MLKMLEAIFHGKIATENIDTTGHKRLRGQLQCYRFPGRSSSQR